MHSIIFISVFFILFVTVNSQNAVGMCTTPIGEAGRCVPIKSCIVIITLLQKAPKPLSSQIVDYITKSHCGYQNNVHHVCCAPRHIEEDEDSSISSTTTTTTSIPRVTTIASRTTIDPIDTTDSNENLNVLQHRNLRLLPLRKCGLALSDKISFGNVTDLGEFPWMAILRYETTDGLNFQCGGSLISSRYVLTAAHCVSGTKDQLVSVRLGENDISTERDCETSDGEVYCFPPAQDIEIEQIIYHPRYNRYRFINDIALIRLAREVKFGEHIQPICLPLTPELQRRELDTVTISGWGTTEKGSASNELLKANIRVIDNPSCQKILKRSLNLQSTQMCAGGENRVDTCKGDSGGPLFFSGNYSFAGLPPIRTVQYGIVSAGGVECGDNVPGIYTRVPYYVKWILDQLRA